MNVKNIEPAVLRPQQAAKYLGVSIGQFWAFARDDETFPRPFKLSKQMTAVVKKDLDAWLDARVGRA